MTPSQSRRHHFPRSNKWCVDDELLALVLQMIVSPTLKSLSQDLDLVERRFEWKATWGRLEIKIHMVGVRDIPRGINRRMYDPARVWRFTGDPLGPGGL